jgi:hypothetical protein
VIHAWIEVAFVGVFALQFIMFLFSKGIAGLCLAFCPRKLVRCKKTYCRKKSKYYEDELVKEDNGVVEIKIPWQKSPQHKVEPLLKESQRS